MKLCFISYARNNNLDNRLGRFVEQLSIQILNHRPARIDEVAFFDVSSISTGQEWMQCLSEQVRTCKVCVCFYSPPYFSSEYCGREVSVFLERIAAWKKLPQAAGKLHSGLIPVIWVPDKIPDALAAYQDSDAALPLRYREEGLLALAMRSNRKNDYNSVLDVLARRIASVLKAVDLPDGANIASFDAVASAFHQQETPVPFGVALAVIAGSTQRLQPFPSGRENLDTLLQSICSAAGAPSREMKVDGKLPGRLRDASMGRELPVVLVGAASLASKNNEKLIKSLDQQLTTDATVVAFDAPRLPSDAAKLHADLTAMLPRFVGLAGPGACIASTDRESLCAALTVRLLKVRRDAIAAAPARRAESAALSRAAAAAGIDVTAQPVLVGPGH